MPLLISLAAWRRAREWRRSLRVEQEGEDAVVLVQEGEVLQAQRDEAVRTQKLRLKAEAVRLLVEEAAREEAATRQGGYLPRWPQGSKGARRDSPSLLAGAT